MNGKAGPAVLREQSYLSGSYRMLRTLDAGDMRERGVDPAGRTWYPAMSDAVVTRAVDVVDAVVLVGESAAPTHAEDVARSAGKPIVVPMAAGGAPDAPAPPAAWTRAATEAYARDLVTWLLGRLDHAESPASEAPILHEAAVALDDPDLERYKERLGRFRNYRRTLTTPNQLIAQQLLTDARRPSHRLVGYGTAQTLSLAALLSALRLERRSLERFPATRTLHRALEVLRSAFDSEQVDAARARAFAVACFKLHRVLLANTASQFERCAECLGLIEGLFGEAALARVAALSRFATDYSAARRDRPEGAARTQLMTRLVDGVRALAIAPSGPEALAWFDEDGDGERIVGLALLLDAPDPAASSIIEQAIGASLSAFEQFTALCAAAAVLPGLDPDQRARLRGLLEAQRGGPPGRISLDDPSRWNLSGDLLRQLQHPVTPPAPVQVPPPEPAGNAAPHRADTSVSPAVAGADTDADGPAPSPGPRAGRTLPEVTGRGVDIYRRALYAQLGYLAAWPLHQALAVGAVGLHVDGGFQHVTSLRDLGITVEMYSDAIPAIQLTSNARIAPTSSDRDRERIELERVGAFVLSTSPGNCRKLVPHVQSDQRIKVTGVSQSRVPRSRRSDDIDEARVDLQSALVDRLAYKEWDPRWIVITEVITVASALLVLSHAGSARVEVNRASGAIEHLTQADPRPMPNAVTVWHTTSTATPLYAASQLRRRFLGIGGYQLVKVRP